MSWYLLKTWVGREEQVAEEIRRSVPSYMYKDCFVIYQERIWRKRQESVVHVERLFPGCAFLVCEETDSFENKHSFFTQLKRTSAIAELMACGDLTIFPMIEEDVDFLSRISGESHIVRLSYVLKDEDGKIRKMSDPLKACCGQVEYYQFKKRYAMVRHRLWGEDRKIVLGIILKEDANQKLLYGDREVSVKTLSRIDDDRATR